MAEHLPFAGVVQEGFSVVLYKASCTARPRWARGPRRRRILSAITPHPPSRIPHPSIHSGKFETSCMSFENKVLQGRTLRASTHSKPAQDLSGRFPVYEQRFIWAERHPIS